MRATRAYIASAGTAAVMLGASLCMFALVSAFIAFGSWPGAKAATRIDQIVLREVARPTPKPVAVRADAVAIAQRQARRSAARLAQQRAVARVPAGTPVARVPSGSSPSQTTAASGTAAGTPVAQVPAPQQTTNKVTQRLQSTTQNTVTQVQQQTQDVQTQVNEVVDQVVGGGGPPSSGSGPVQTVTNTAGSLLGH